MLIVVSTQGPIDWKTFLSDDAGKLSNEQEDTFFELTNFSSSASETDKKLSQITAGVGTADGEKCFLTLQKKKNSIKKERNFSQS